MEGPANQYRGSTYILASFMQIKNVKNKLPIFKVFDNTRDEKNCMGKKLSPKYITSAKLPR